MSGSRTIGEGEKRLENDHAGNLLLSELLEAKRKLSRELDRIVQRAA